MAAAADGPCAKYIKKWKRKQANEMEQNGTEQSKLTEKIFCKKIIFPHTTHYNWWLR